MFPFDKDNIFRKISQKLLMKPLLWSGLSANQITVINFIFFGIGSLICFLTQHRYLGLILGAFMAMLDYCDGEVARIQNSGSTSQLGAFLDTSLDYLYLMLLIGVLGYSYNCLLYSFIALIAITFGNWIEFSANVKVKLPFFVTNLSLLTIGLLTGYVKFAIIFVTIVQSLKTIILYRRAICSI